MQPTTNAFEPREDLGVTIEEIDSAAQRRKFVGTQIMPILARSEPTGKVPRIEADQVLQEHEVDYSAKTPINRVELEFSRDDYESRGKAIELPITQRTLKRYDDLIDAETHMSNLGDYIILSALERDILGLITDVSAGTTFEHFNDAAPLAFSDPLADPIAVVDEYREKVLLNYGEEPRSLACSGKTLRNIANTNVVIDRSKGQSFQDVRGRQIVNIAAVAAALDLDEIQVGNSVRINPAYVAAKAAGNWNPRTTPKFVRSFPTDRVLLHVTPSEEDGIVKGVGRTVVWSEEAEFAEGRMGILASSYEEPQTRTTVMQKMADWGLKVFHAEAGYVITGT